MANSTVLYKYRTWSDKNHQSCLKNNELFFASPSEINDPFDFKISMDYRLLDTDDKRERYIDKVLEKIKHVIKKDMNFEFERQHLLNRLKNEPDQLQEEYEASDYKAMDRKMGVLSLSERWNSILMWTHYAEGHKGFCIGFNREKLEGFGFFGICGPVHYSNDFPIIDPLNPDLSNVAITKSHTKAKEWCYEEEVRFSQVWVPDDPSIDDRVIRFPTDFIEEIILGLNIPPAHQQEIVDIAERKRIPIYKIEKVPRSFLINKIPLNK